MTPPSVVSSRLTHRCRIHRGDARQRLDVALVRRLDEIPGLSRTRIQEWIAEGLVRLNGVVVRKASERLAAGDEVEIELPPPPPRPEMAAQEIPLSILYEDEHLVAVDKPPGLVVHPTFGHRDGTLLNALLWHLRQRGEDAESLGPVSRLDKWTSGVLVVARGGEAHARLARALKSPTSEKEYWAVVYGQTGVDHGRIDLRVLRDSEDRRRMTTSKTEGVAASTLFSTLAETAGAGVALSLLRCVLLTGRMHQIRVHLRARGWPIVGDPVYGEPRWKGIADPALAALCRDFPRQALHARRLVFRHPVTGEPVEIVAPVPADMGELLAAAGIPPSS